MTTPRLLRVLLLALLACAGCASSDGTWIDPGLHEVPVRSRAADPPEGDDHDPDVGPDEASASPHR